MGFCRQRFHVMRTSTTPTHAMAMTEKLMYSVFRKYSSAVTQDRDSSSKA